MSKLDSVNKWLAVLQGVAVIGGVLVALWQLHLNQIATSASYALEVEKREDAGQIGQIENTIDDGASTTPVIAETDKGPFKEDDVYNYIGQLDDVGMLVNEGVINWNMAENDFSFDAEKAWCNNDIRSSILGMQADDTSKTVTSSPYYGDFETFAKQSLIRDGFNCSTIDSQN